MFTKRIFTGVLIMYVGLRLTEGAFRLWFSKAANEGGPFGIIGEAGKMGLGR